MSVLGINLEKNGLRYTVMEGIKDAPKFIEKQKVAINSASDISELMNWYETTFQNLVSKYTPSKSGIKLSLEAKKKLLSPFIFAYYNRKFLIQSRAITSLENLLSVDVPSLILSLFFFIVFSF